MRFNKYKKRELIEDAQRYLDNKAATPVQVDYLRELMVFKQVSQMQLASELGITRQGLNNKLRGRHPLTQWELHILMKVFNLTPNEREEFLSIMFDFERTEVFEEGEFIYDKGQRVDIERLFDA